MNIKRLIVDLDNTISYTIKGDYVNSKPIEQTINMLRKYHDEGWEIVINSSRNMRTYDANVGKINIYTLPMHNDNVLRQKALLANALRLYSEYKSL